MLLRVNFDKLSLRDGCLPVQAAQHDHLLLLLRAVQDAEGSTKQACFIASSWCEDSQNRCVVPSAE